MSSRFRQRMRWCFESRWHSLVEQLHFGCERWLARVECGFEWKCDGGGLPVELNALSLHSRDDQRTRDGEPTAEVAACVPDRFANRRRVPSVLNVERSDSCQNCELVMLLSCVS